MSLATEQWPTQGLDHCSSCPACGSSERQAWAQDIPDRLFHCAPGLWTFHRCVRCGSLYIDPRPSRDTIGDAYRDYYTHEVAIQSAAPPSTLVARWRERLRHGYLNRRFGLDLPGGSALGPVVVPLIPGLARRQRQWARLPLPRPNATLLDVGTGSGAAVVHFRRLGWDACGIDVDDAAVASATAAGIPVTEGEITSIAGEDRFDAITMSHSIEHLHDPVAALTAAYRLLKPHGVIEIGTPNAASLGSRYYRSDWLGLDAPRHLILFTQEGLAHALEGAGFADLRLQRPARPSRWYFEASEAIRQGRDWTAGAVLPPRARVALAYASAVARFRPRLAEELLVVAVKPAS